MHNMAIALHKKGHIVSGSDDDIFEPSRSRLDMHGLLPDKMGWDKANIKPGIDVVILGMHARDDNPELVEARKINLNIKSFPEFLYEETRDKLRLVVGGSHGKTTITSMIMHVLKSSGIRFDYMVGSIIEGFDTMVGLDDEARIAIFEGDEYLSSALDRRPKFHLYKPDIAIISGIAWDHINVFPEFEIYVDQFRIFIDKLMPSGKLIYFEGDSIVKELADKSREDITKIPYKACQYSRGPEGYSLTYNNKNYPLSIFGEHNMQNINASMEACMLLGISREDFLESIAGFSGSARRLQLLAEDKDRAVYLDFAHAPSKVRATVSALADRYPDHKRVCCFELHTFSSLNPDFLKEYKDCLSRSDIGYVYYNPHVLELKKLKPLSAEYVMEAFGSGLSAVFDDADKLLERVKETGSDRVVYLFMSSGDFNGIDFDLLSEGLLRD